MEQDRGAGVKGSPVARLLGAARLLALCGVLGLATTVLVAWALAAWLPHRSLTKRYNLVGSARSGAGFVSVYEVRRPGMIRRGWGPGFSARPSFWGELTKDATIALKLKTANQDRSWGALPAALAGGSAGALSGMEDARGWPFLSLWCSLDDSAIQGIGAGEPAPGGIAVTRGGTKATAAHFRALPMTPIWTGMAANTGVYTAGWAGALGVAWAVRRAVRRRRGWCVACGYDVMGDRAGGCPECGRGRAETMAAAVSCGDDDLARG